MRNRDAPMGGGGGGNKKRKREKSTAAKVLVETILCVRYTR